jgi:hypothetical protein
MNAELKVGMDSPQTVAAAIERVLREEPSEYLLGAPERLFAKLNALLPSLVDRSLRRQLAVIRRHASPASSASPRPASAAVSINP